MTFNTLGVGYVDGDWSEILAPVGMGWVLLARSDGRLEVRRIQEVRWSREQTMARSQPVQVLVENIVETPVVSNLVEVPAVYNKIEAPTVTTRASLADDTPVQVKVVEMPARRTSAKKQVKRDRQGLITEVNEQYVDEDVA
jgi:hypothetical protein